MTAPPDAPGAPEGATGQDLPGRGVKAKGTATPGQRPRPRRLPRQGDLGPPVPREGAKCWITRDDFDAATVAYRLFETGQAEAILRRGGVNRHLLAALCGVGEGTVGHWASEERRLPLHHAVRIGRLLMVLTVEQLDTDRRGRSPAEWELADDDTDGGER